MHDAFADLTSFLSMAATWTAAGATGMAAYYAYQAFTNQREQVDLLTRQLEDVREASEREREANTPEYELSDLVTLPHGKNLMVSTFWKDRRGGESAYLQNCIQQPGPMALLHLPLFNRRRSAAPLQIDVSSPDEIANLIHPQTITLQGFFNNAYVTNEPRELVFIQLSVTGQEVNDRKPVEIHLNIRLATGSLVQKKFRYCLGTSEIEWIA